ncbi:hypothetical protein EYC80_001305 [Monilinia laxa]|uniref:ABM domain-containing protein n=1 Tax=Monilinia laxa TaxID=61186 RepID=A0A5N6K8X7_MONLA|nr:hypothetical protein EYC80_001305 [Monilinia laxa]
MLVGDFGVGLDLGLGLKEGLRLKKIIGRREALQTVARQKGCTDSYYGAGEEEEGVLVWCIDWSSLAHHKAFMNSPAYPPFLKSLAPIMKSAQIMHVPRLSLNGAIGNGVVEIAVFFDIEDLFLQGTRKFIKAIREIDAERGIQGFRGVVVFGEVWERIARREGGEEGRAVVLMLGWESLEAHLAFTKTQDFTDSTKYLKEGTGGVEMFHVSFRRAGG